MSGEPVPCSRAIISGYAAGFVWELALVECLVTTDLAWMVMTHCCCCDYILLFYVWFWCCSQG